MLRISKKADYAVFLLGAIARQGAYPGGSAADSVVSAHEIARLAGLNKSVVANLLKEFGRHGLLESVRGLRGGYRLARTPQQISLGQILEVVEGKFVLVDCVQPRVPDFGLAAARSPENTAAPDAASPEAGTPEAGTPEAGTLEATNAALPVAATHDCSLIAFCPSKQPMRVVHQRISQLFDQIRLDELCALKPASAEHPTPPANATRPQPALSSRPR